jgi:hypothetical protein
LAVGNRRADMVVQYLRPAPGLRKDGEET